MPENTPPRRRGPYAKSAARREQIVAAAFEVFASRGYHRGSFQDIADRLGVSQTSLFHYFPKKSDLLVAVLERRDDVAEGTSPTGGPLAFIDRLLRQARKNETIPGVIALYTVLCGEAVTEDHPARPYFTERFARVRAEYADEFRALAEAGVLRPGVDPEIAASTVLALWDGAQTHWLFDPDAVDVTACLRDYLALIVVTDGVD